MSDVIRLKQFRFTCESLKYFRILNVDMDIGEEYERLMQRMEQQPRVGELIEEKEKYDPILRAYHEFLRAMTPKPAVGTSDSTDRPDVNLEILLC